MELSKTSYVILGMLRGRPHTGYEIKALVDDSTRFFWAASYGQIYPELKRLEEAGLVKGEAESQGARRRRSFSLTPEGRRELEDWISSGEPLHFELRHEGLLRFFFADVVDPAEQVELVRDMREMHERTRGRDGGDPPPRRGGPRGARPGVPAAHARVRDRLPRVRRRLVLAHGARARRRELTDVRPPRTPCKQPPQAGGRHRPRGRGAGRRVRRQRRRGARPLRRRRPAGRLGEVRRAAGGARSGYDPATAADRRRRRCASRDEGASGWSACSRPIPTSRSSTSFYDSRERAQVSKDGRSQLIAVNFKTSDDGVQQDAAKRLGEELNGDGVKLGGLAAASGDVNEQVSEDLARAEMLAFPILFLLSVLFFRSLVAAALPLLVGRPVDRRHLRGAEADQRLRRRLGVRAQPDHRPRASGLAIDYSLFIVARYREEMERFGPGAEAMRRTLATAGPHRVLQLAHGGRRAGVPAGLPAAVPLLDGPRRVDGRADRRLRGAAWCCRRCWCCSATA